MAAFLPGIISFGLGAFFFWKDKAEPAVKTAKAVVGAVKKKEKPGKVKPAPKKQEEPENE